jgi:hypothetical protein
MMKNLFEAGMAQRTWMGPGNPYPMKTSETRGCSQETIDIMMTPSLNAVNDEYEALTSDIRGLVNSLPILNYLEGKFVQGSESMMQFIREVREGDICVGYGSASLIYSAYYYLNKLGFEIPDFQFEKFEGESTHR